MATPYICGRLLQLALLWLEKSRTKNSLFFVAGATDTKVCHSTVVTTTNSTDEHQIYKSVAYLIFVASISSSASVNLIFTEGIFSSQLTWKGPLAVYLFTQCVMSHTMCNFTHSVYFYSLCLNFFVARQFLPQIYAFLSVKYTGLKIC